MNLDAKSAYALIREFQKTIIESLEGDHPCAAEVDLWLGEYEQQSKPNQESSDLAAENEILKGLLRQARLMIHERRPTGLVIYRNARKAWIDQYNQLSIEKEEA